MRFFVFCFFILIMPLYGAAFKTRARIPEIAVRPDISKKRAQSIVNRIRKEFGVNNNDVPEVTFVFSNLGLRREWHFMYKEIVIWLEASTGTLVHLSEFGNFLKQEKATTIISESMAVKKALAFAQKFNITLRKETLQVKVEDLIDLKPGDEYGRFYTITQNIKLDQIPCFDSTIQIGIAANNGRVSTFHIGYIPTNQDIPKMYLSEDKVVDILARNNITANKLKLFFVNTYMQNIEASNHKPMLVWYGFLTTRLEKKAMNIMLNAKSGKILKSFQKEHR